MATGKRKVKIPGKKAPEHEGLTLAGVKARVSKLINCLNFLTFGRQAEMWSDHYEECGTIGDFLSLEMVLLTALYSETSGLSKKSKIVRKGSARSF